MRKNIRPMTLRCGICGKLYSSKNDDGSGLCLSCRPEQSQSLVTVKKHRLKRTIVMEVDKPMDDFDQEELKAFEVDVEGVKEEEKSEDTIAIAAPDNVASEQEIVSEQKELKIEDIIQPGRYGVSNSQMIPAMKQAIAEGSIEKLQMLKTSYFYTFDKSIKYLKKAEREFIANNNI